jgi:hypothetical protein
MSTETNEPSEQSAERPLSRRADPARVHPVQQLRRFHDFLASAVDTPADNLDPTFWSRCTEIFGRRDIVLVEPLDGSWLDVLKVVDVSADGVMMQRLGGTEVMRHRMPPPKPGPQGTNPDDFGIQRSDEFPDRWAVVRTHDKHVMTKGTPLTRLQCEDWLRQYLATMRKT